MEAVCLLILFLDMVPKLIDFDWRVSSNLNKVTDTSDQQASHRSGQQQQTCILQLKVRFVYSLICILLLNACVFGL